ncbi:MAG: shikimate kinase [Crocinitomicaceae bacterium]|nr:shikimate kinase [Crocinitomicaceae bacterium]
MNKNKPIILLGFMGVGKTSIGKKLSKQLNWKFLDTDKLIEKKIGLPIPEIFNQLGEDFFREQEREILNEIASLENVVVSVGGGLPCFFDNMDRLNNIGTTVYLKLEPEFIVQRLLESKIKRPLTVNLIETQLKDFVKVKLTERERYYSLAMYGFRADRYACEQIFNLISSD